jgi:hypothetical protein
MSGGRSNSRPIYRIGSVGSCAGRRSAATRSTKGDRAGKPGGHADLAGGPLGDDLSAAGYLGREEGSAWQLSPADLFIGDAGEAGRRRQLGNFSHVASDVGHKEYAAFLGQEIGRHRVCVTIPR